MASKTLPTLGWVLTLMVFVAGCQSLGNRNLLAQGDSAAETPAMSNPVVQVAGIEDDEPVVQRASTTPTMGESAKKSADRLMNFVAGREQEDLDQAQVLYRVGDSTFRRAQELERGQREDVFADAAKQFRKAAEASKGAALQQDAMFMHAESLFFSNQLNQAAKVYEKLQIPPKY